MEQYKPDVVLYHDDCMDGYGAAFAVWLKYGDNVQYIAVKYGDAPPDAIKDKHVLLVDFSYKQQDIQKYFTELKSVIILDHHKTALHELHTYTLDDVPLTCISATNLIDANRMEDGSAIIATFDMCKSGAVIAWNFCHPDKPVPELFLYIQDRDLWQHKLRWTKEVNAALSSYEKTFYEWQYQFCDWLSNKDQRDESITRDNLRVTGESILRARKQLVESIAEETISTVMFNHSINKKWNTVVCNCPHTLASDVGHFLCENKSSFDFDLAEAFSTTYYINKEGNYVYSLRSLEGGADVSDIAKKFGGGGHRNAAGFTSYYSCHKSISN